MRELLAFSALLAALNAPAQIFTEDFESGSGGYTTSTVECNTVSDYFALTNVGGISATLTGNATNFFAAQDIDGCAGSSLQTITWSGINISGCSGLSFSIDLAEDDDGSNQDWDDSDFFHVDYSIDAGPSQPLIWVENDGSAFNSAPYIDTDYNGTGDGTEITDTWSTFTQGIAGTGTSLTITITINLDSGDEDIAFDNLVVTGTSCGGCPGLAAEPTVEVTDNGPVAGCTSGTINWTLGADAENVIVVYSTSPITGTPTDGVNYPVGSTIAPGEEVVYNGSGNSVSIGGLTSGVTYYYAIFEYNGTLLNCEENYLTGGVTGSFTTMAGCQEPYIQSINYNACTGAEGTDEIVVVSMGDDAVPVDSLVIDLPNTTWCNTTCGTNTIVNNATYINDLNTMAGCVLFTYCDPIPAGATLMIFTGNPPSTVIDYSGNCSGTGAPYCAIFLDNSSLTGNFSNNSSTPRVTTIHFGSSSSSTVSYTATDGVGDVDGATADFDENGNVSYSQNNSCVYPLAVTMKTLTGHHVNGVNKLNWSTASEQNSNYFEVQRSEDGVSWETIGLVGAARSSSTLKEYFYEDVNAPAGLTYYRLALIDLNGQREYANIISIENASFSVFYDQSVISIGFDQIPAKTYQLNIYDLSGNLIYKESAYNGMSVPWSKKGFFILEIPELNCRQKLVTR